jgi:hypothetical protein
MKSIRSSPDECGTDSAQFRSFDGVPSVVDGVVDRFDESYSKDELGDDDYL